MTDDEQAEIEALARASISAHVFIDILSAIDYERLAETMDQGDVIERAAMRFRDAGARGDVTALVVGATSVIYRLVSEVMQLTGTDQHDVLSWLRDEV